MSRPTQVTRSSIAVIGGGAAGALTATRLVDEAGRRHRPIEITIIEPRQVAGRGVAFSATDNRHLLNVPVRGMSAYPEDAEHFARWLEAHDERPVDLDSFVPRSRYGTYLSHVLDEAQRRTPLASVVHVRDRAVDVDDDGRRTRVQLESGAEVEVDAVVLAIGHLGPDVSWVPAALVDSPRFVSDPWLPGALDAVDPDLDVLVVGTGLTMVDAVRVLDRPRRVVHAVSRHGIMPREHLVRRGPGMEAPDFGTDQPTLAQIQAVMTAHIAKSQARYGDWRPAVDSVRALTQRLWAGLSDRDRSEFLALDARHWDAVRHRVPPASAAAIRAARGADRLEVHQGSLSAVAPTADGLEVTLIDGTVLTVGAVVNCTGPAARPVASEDPLVRALLERGLARPGPVGLGFDTFPDGQLRSVDGEVRAPIWTLGSLRRGTLWETSAIPEIRQQAAGLAHCILGPALGRDRRPRDRYGLPLSATPEAADAWCRALHSICTLEDDVERTLREAVRADPGFAMGHAALALVGHEWGAPVDVNASLAAAVDTALFRGDARERSFVQAVVSRLTSGPLAGDRDLLRHIGEYPLDALAVSVALPTIAFSGLTQPVTESWALADRLALSYGDDWWFAGMLAFVRQEQERWEDAERLSLRSLREVPGSGHAVHARTHVFYETGDHRGGLRWLDGWIAAHAEASDYAAHFSWHAALHELALDDPGAVRRRFRRQLGPQHVAGPRALVDSASLLWRSRLAGGWPDDLPIAEVLASVPPCLLDHPATTFAAMHAVVAHAAAADAEAIDRLRTFAAGYSDPTYQELIVPLCDGFAAHVRGEPAVAAAHLAAVAPAAGRLGGSAAQQEVISETLVHALIGSGQHQAARQILERQLERRPRPSDLSRLAGLTR